MPGGFHPFHAGHASLYKDAVKAFPGADVYVTASNDTSERSFPFAIKEKLARVAGVPAGRFVQVKSPFTSEEITSRYDHNDTVLIFVKSEKNSKNGSDPEGPFPAEVDPATGKLPLVKRGKRKGLPVSDTLKYYAGNEKNLQPMSRNRYIAYLSTVPFGPGIKSGSEFRALWDRFTKVLLNPKSTPEQKEKATELKTEFITNMYPATQENPRLAAEVVKDMDKGMSNPLTNKSDLAEGSLNEFVPPSNYRGDGNGDSERSRRIRILLGIAIEAAKRQKVGSMGDILAMNTIAGDDFFSVAVEGLLPDITHKELVFVLQSAYNTEKQGLAEGKRKKKSKTRSLGRYFFPGYGYYGGSGESGEGGGEGGGDGGGEGVAEAEKIAKVFHPQYVDVYYLDGPRRTPILVNRKVPYNLIDRYLEVAIKKYNLQQGRFEFRNAEEDPVKVTESVDYLEEK